MQIGYNNDVEYRGMTFHIQTEDRGDVDCCVETQLFFRGQVLDTRVIPYADKLAPFQESVRQQKIQALMRASHKVLYKKLIAGEYDLEIGLEPASEATVERMKAQVETEFTPSHLQEESLPEGLLAEDEHGAHVSLSELSAHFFQIEQDSEAEHTLVSNSAMELSLADEFSEALLMENADDESWRRETPTNVMQASDVEQLMSGVTSEPSSRSTQVIGSNDMQALLEMVSSGASSSPQTGVMQASDVNDLIAMIAVDNEPVSTQVMDASAIKALVSKTAANEGHEHRDSASEHKSISTHSGRTSSAEPLSDANQKSAWLGCPELSEDLSIDDLVEDFLNS